MCTRRWYQKTNQPTNKTPDWSVPLNGHEWSFYGIDLIDRHKCQFIQHNKVLLGNHVLRGNLYDLINILNYYSNLKKHNKQYHKKTLSRAFIWMVTLLGLIHGIKTQNHLVHHSKQHHSKVLQAAVVQKVNKAIHCLNISSVDNSIVFHNTYALVSDLSGG